LVERVSLPDFVPGGIFVGTSLILNQGDRFLYGMRPPRAEGAHQVIELTGIGGAMEDEDASVMTGVLREAQEEIGCDVRLLPCRETVVVRGPDQVERVVLQGQARPAAVVLRHYRTPPHQPWHENNQGQGCLVVFAGELYGRPRPGMELPALIWLKPAQILETAWRDVPLGELLNAGAELVQSEGKPMPERAWVCLTDSQEALVLALGDDALSFYEALVESRKARRVVQSSKRRCSPTTLR
jgi:8-oxo-dGTP pyrophosphatase MutT (NUDIX family)